MYFESLILKNLWRRRGRTLLTIGGVAIGIGAVVALAGMAWGFERTWVRAYDARGTDLIVMKITSDSPMPELFGASRVADLKSLPHVREISATLTSLMSIEETSAMLVFGWQSHSYLWDHLRLVRGRWPVNDDEPVVVVGSVAAEVLHKQVGDKIQIETASLTVCGIAESSALADNGSVMMTLPQLQRATESEGKINALNLRLDPAATPADVDALKVAIRARLAGYDAFTGNEVAENNSAIQAAKGMSWATSVLALAIGAVGVMNTMLMSVFERTREIGVLLAIGWRRRRIIRMILVESVILSTVGGIAGIAMGIVAIKLLQLTPLVRGKIEGEVSVSLCGLALGIAVALGVLGGLYPALRASRLPPHEALRYE